MYSTFHFNVTWFLQKYKSKKVLPRFELRVPSAHRYTTEPTWLED